MTDQTKHDIGGLQTENKAKRHELEKLQNEMDDAMESLSITDNDSIASLIASSALAISCDLALFSVCKPPISCLV